LVDCCAKNVIRGLKFVFDRTFTSIRRSTPSSLQVHSTKNGFRHVLKTFTSTNPPTSTVLASTEASGHVCRGGSDSTAASSNPIASGPLNAPARAALPFFSFPRRGTSLQISVSSSVAFPTVFTSLDLSRFFTLSPPLLIRSFPC
jgi:hypothetical protein